MEILLLSVLAALITSDAVILGQFGFSRPIVCGPIIGYFLGDMQLGLNVGIILELIWINTIPIGTALVPDVAAATILSVFWSAKINPYFAHKEALAVYSIMVALPLSFIFRKTDLLQRQLNSRWNDVVDRGIGRNQFSVISGVVFSSLFIFILKNALLFYLCMQLHKPLRELLSFSNPRIIKGLSLSYFFLPAIGIGVFVFNFYDSLLKIIIRRKKP